MLRDRLTADPESTQDFGGLWPPRLVVSRNKRGTINFPDSILCIEGKRERILGWVFEFDE
jgi:hypothetical protein